MSAAIRVFCRVPITSTSIYHHICSASFSVAWIAGMVIWFIVVLVSWMVSGCLLQQILKLHQFASEACQLMPTLASGA